jgi:signal transduction histidine kinase
MRSDADERGDQMTRLLLGTTPPEQREFAEVVGSSGDALLHVIDDILDYSKIEAGKRDSSASRSTSGCVEEALDIAPRAAEKAWRSARWSARASRRRSAVTRRACARCCSTCSRTRSSSRTQERSSSTSTPNRRTGLVSRASTVQDTGIGSRRIESIICSVVQPGRRLDHAATGLNIAV